MSPLFKTLSENINGRDFVVGDIHGDFEALERALGKAGFDPAKDRVISVGDLIDRGAFSARCLEFLDKPWFHAVRGNHEDMFLEVCPNGIPDIPLVKANLGNGMGWILETDAATLKKIHDKFMNLPVAMEVPTPRGTVGFVHAEVPHGMDWDKFKSQLAAQDARTIQTALWGRRRINHADDSGVAGIDRIFHGHTPQKGGAVRLGNCYYVDTGAVFRGLMGGQGAQYGMTFADITAHTVAFNGKAGFSESKADHVIEEKPVGKKPFGKYGSSRKK